MTEDEWDKFSDKIDDEYLIHKVRRKVCITNIDCLTSGLFNYKHVIAFYPEHELYKCLIQIWDLDGESRDFVRLVLYKNNDCINEEKPTGIFSVGIQLEFGMVYVTSPLDI